MKKALITATAWLVPLAASAQLTNVENLATAIGRVVGILIPIVFALAMLFFFWGLAQYILNAGDPEAQKAGRSKMIWGIVAIFVMAAIWGLVAWLGTALDIDTGGEPGFNVGDLVPDP